MAIVNKVIIVEGKSDKKRVQQVIAEPANIICTHGTMSIDKIDNMIETLYDKQVYVLADSDDEKLELLASDGMLVKRPLAISGNHLTLGFKENEYQHQWL